MAGTAAAVASGRGQSMARVTAAVASGLLLAAAFPRVNLSALAWVALAPLLVAMRGRGLRQSAALGWTTGFVFFLATLYWVPDTISNFTSIEPALALGLWVLMSAAAANAHTFFAVGVEWLAAGGHSRLLTVPLVWAVVEWSRTFFLMGFPWNPLGNSQMRMPLFAQFADIGGVYGLSAVIALASAALAEAWARRRMDDGHGNVGGASVGGANAAVSSVAASSPAGASPASAGIAPLLVLAAACPAAMLLYGVTRLAWIDSVPYSGSLRVAVAQGNIAQDQKWDETLQDRIFARYLDLTTQAADAGARLVVWPEAALPFYLRQDMRSIELVKIARERGIDLLVGAPGYEDRGDGQGLRDRNQAWLIRSSGDLAGPYDKIQLVPFGEYIPLYGLFGMVDIAVESVGQMGKGTERVIFESAPFSPPLEEGTTGSGSASTDGGEPASGVIAGREDPVTGARGDGAAGEDPVVGRPARFGVLICYEGIFPGLTREFAAAGADFLVNISNDAWYGDTAAPDQHLVMAAMRAIENRMPMVRSTNTGFSAFVTDEGELSSMTGLFREEMAMETVLVRNVWSFYRLYGDVFVYACLMILMVLGAASWRSRKVTTS